LCKRVAMVLPFFLKHLRERLIMVIYHAKKKSAQPKTPGEVQLQQ
jgi:hypothetical protein